MLTGRPIDCKENNLVSTTSLGSEYIVSFEIFVNSFSVPNLKAGKYAEIIRLTTTEGNCCENGDRIVQISTVGGEESDGIEFSSSTGGMDAYFYHKFEILKDVWTKVDIELLADAASGEVVSWLNFNLAYLEYFSALL